MNKLLKGLKLYATETSPNQYYFTISRHARVNGEIPVKSHIIFATLYKSLRAWTIKKYTTLYTVGYPYKSYEKKYEGYGLATALIMLQFLFALQKFGCTTIVTTPLINKRVGGMYKSIGMKKTWLKHTILYFLILKKPVFFFKGVYNKQVVEIIQKNTMVKLLCEEILKEGVVLDRFIDTYTDVAEDMINNNFKEFGNQLLKAAKSLTDRVV